MAGKTVTIGVLALQGDSQLHAACLRQLKIEPLLVKSPDQLQALDGLIIPGGESTALLKLAEPIGMMPAIKQFAADGGHIFGTCAGAIIVAKTVTNPVQSSLGLIDITVERNGYGRQLQSSDAVGQACQPFGKNKLPLTFIRAPRITAVGKNAKTLITYQNEAVLVEQDNILAATFHPELTDDLQVYRYWLGVIDAR